VAMENLADQVELGTSFSHTLNHMDGQIALVAACAKNLSAADHAAIYKLCRGYFKI